MTASRKTPSDAAGGMGPQSDASNLDEFLQLDPANVPPAVGSLLAVFREPVGSYELPGEEAVPPHAVRAIVAELVERQHTEREVFLSALQAYKELSERLGLEVAEARSELAALTEEARIERAQLLQEFLDRLDVLSAKISTSAARYESELAAKDVLIADHEQRAETYAGHAANAQSIIEDIHQSTSWRVTAPVRLLSRMLARRATPAQPES